MSDIYYLLKNSFDIDTKYVNLVNREEKKLYKNFEELDKIREYNQYKILKAFQENMLSASDFYWTTGYGYGDIGRDKVEAIYSNIFNSEDSLVRPSIASGTHAINLVLSGLLKSGDEFLEISGSPYDTLKEVIGLNTKDNEGSLLDRGVLYGEVALKNKSLDTRAILNRITSLTKLVAIQRSTGYSDRPAIAINEMEKTIKAIKKSFPDVIVFVDNCYGEFTEINEPTDVGADIIAGSLIKNPGGGIAFAGGYICGKKRLIDLISRRLTAPGLEKEVGLSFGTTKSTLQGLFLAPLVVNQALKGALLISRVYSSLGYKVIPGPEQARSDIVQAIEFGDPKALELFCYAIQKSSAVDSFVRPIAGDMPGYENQVIMAAGGFVDGSSIEMSADGPLREPFYAYYQGGLSLDQIKLAIFNSLKELDQAGYINIKE